ncbi:hypothetical protein EDB81DRAFT_672333, partial [Dactylonectria macrodidyma]
MADSIPLKKVCRNCKQAKPADQFISKKKSSISCGRLTVDCLDCRNRQASRASKRTAEQAELSPKRRGGLPLIDLQLRTPILPKESEVADTEWRNDAEAIARSLPRRPLRGGLRSNRARKSHDTANSGGSALHQPPSQLQRPLSPRERGAPEAAGSDPPLVHQRFLPQERRDGDDERRGRAAIIQPKQSVSEDIRRSELAAAIARGLPQRRRGRGRPPKARPDTSGASNIGGSEQHPALTHRDEPPRKQIRAGTRRQRRRELQAEDLASVLRFLEDEFAVKESLSNEQTCCTPIPHERKVSTVRTFYKAFHDVDTLPIWTCMLCYRKRTKNELRDLRRKGEPLAIFMSELLSRGRDLLCMCGVRSLLEAGCSVACGPASQTYWVGLTPVEEKLIALNSCYGFVTRYSIASSQKQQSARYPKHIKGHITVFPNNVQELATKVLPHPLVQVMEEIHVSWQGAEKPAPSDLSGLLSVRRRVVERALVWLKKNNPHYAEIEIDAAEMES